MIVVLAFVAASFSFRPQQAHGAVGPEGTPQLAPAGAHFFFAAPDLGRTKKRWTETGLHQITQETEWKEFTGKLDQWITSQVPAEQVKETLRQWEEMDLAGFFVAVTVVDGEGPQLAGGVAYRGEQAKLKAAVEKLSQRLSAGRGEKVEKAEYEGIAIESLSLGRGLPLAVAYRDQWLLFASNVEQMKELLKRYQAGAAGADKSLAGSPRFKACMPHAVAEADFIAYVNAGEIIKGVHAAHGADAARVEEPWEAYLPEAAFYSLKLDGREIRSRTYIRAPKWPKIPPMANRLAAFTNSDTYAYASLNAAGMEDLLRLVLSEAEKDREFREDLAAKGLKPTELAAIFGPEISVHSDWEQVAPFPNAFAAVEVRDAAKARLFAEALVEQFAETTRGKISKKDEDGVTYWTAAIGVVVAQPTLALSDKHLVFGLNYATAVEGLRQWKKGEGHLGQAPSFQQALKAVLPPTMGTVYVDTKKLFERVYEKVKPLAAMELAGHEELAKYLDPGKIPRAETISKHLSPTTIVAAGAADGFTIETLGPLPLESLMLPGAIFFTFRAAPAPLQR